MVRLCELPSERKSPVVILAKAGDLAVGGRCVSIGHLRRDRPGTPQDSHRICT